MADDPTQQTPVVENPTPQKTSALEVVSPVPDSSNPSIPQNPPDIPVVETPIPEPEPVVAPEPTPVVDVPIPNFRFPFNSDFPVTFPFNSQPTTDEMKAKFSQWEIAGHHGVDFGLPEGTEVVAVDAGKVLQSSENGDYGNSVTIQHSWGQSLYAHLKETKVSEDQQVNAGDVVGLSGQTGAAFGAHLHFGIKPNNPNEVNGYLGFIDPTQYLPQTFTPRSLAEVRPNPPDNPVSEPEKPKVEEPAPEIKVEESKPVEVPIPDVSINIEPIIPPPQPIQPLPPQEPVTNNDDQIQKQVNEKFNAELEARRLKANEARKDKRQEHLQEIEKLLQEKKEITNQDVRDLTHVSQTTATEYLSTLVKSGRIKVEGKGKATVYKNIFS